MGGPASPRLSKATFLPPPSLCPPPLTQAAGAPPSQGDVSPAPPPAGALWPNMANTAVLGSWDRLGGRGGGPWPGLLAAGEGEGSPWLGGGGGRKDKSRREAGPPSLPLAHWLHARPTFQAHSWGSKAPTQGPAGDPHPTQPCPGALCAGYAAVWVPRLMPSENICTPPPSPRHSRALAGGQWRLAGG